MNFDRIAGVYDLLAGLVFGNTIRSSQLYYLSTIPPHAKVLILGGGTGWIIPEIFKAAPDCQLTYIEASEKMLEMSRRKAGEYKAQTTFIHGTEKAIPDAVRYDVVITNFLLDLFKKEELPHFISLIDQRLTTKGKWLVTDFEMYGRDRNPKWQKSLISLMYWFFGKVSRIGIKELADYQQMIQKCGFRKEGSKRFYFGMIESLVYKKT